MKKRGKTIGKKDWDKGAKGKVLKRTGENTQKVSEKESTHCRKGGLSVRRKPSYKERGVNKRVGGKEKEKKEKASDRKRGERLFRDTPGRRWGGLHKRKGSRPVKHLKIRDKAPRGV